MADRCGLAAVFPRVGCASFTGRTTRRPDGGKNFRALA
ncbi:hypothetical protein P355_3967 [Burkholderia cenocepacia KC-01]|nr:hypothetical protein P355_3967 [Burkholderia cenocepacia KC-01]